jgi:hypothetical protein
MLSMADGGQRWKAKKPPSSQIGHAVVKKNPPPQSTMAGI